MTVRKSCSWRSTFSAANIAALFASALCKWMFFGDLKGSFAFKLKASDSAARSADEF
jgi:hypothetical protein